MMKPENAVVIKLALSRNEGDVALRRELQLRIQGKIRCGCVGGCGIENCPGNSASSASVPEGGI